MQSSGARFASILLNLSWDVQVFARFDQWRGCVYFYKISMKLTSFLVKENLKSFFLESLRKPLNLILPHFRFFRFSSRSQSRGIFWLTNYSIPLWLGKISSYELWLWCVRCNKVCFILFFGAFKANPSLFKVNDILFNAIHLSLTTSLHPTLIYLYLLFLCIVL